MEDKTKRKEKEGINKVKLVKFLLTIVLLAIFF